MADKKQKYKRYYTEWDKMSSDEKYYDKTNNYNKPTYRNDNNKFQLTKTLMKKYKHKAKPAFDENELKELFKKNDYSEEQINKEINYKLKEINEKGYEFGWHEVKKGKKKNNNFDNEYNPSRTLENFSQRLPKEKYNEYQLNIKNYLLAKSRSFDIKEESENIEKLKEKVVTLEHIKFLLNM